MATSSPSLPFVFDRYILAGTVVLATAEGDTLAITPESRQVRLAYPLWGSIQNFGESARSNAPRGDGIGRGRRGRSRTVQRR